MNFQFGLTFFIFVLGNGEVSWSMWTFHLRSSFHSISLLFIQNWNSICTWIPSTLHFHLCSHLYCDISYFADLSFPFLCRSSMMKSGLTCSLVIWPKLCITFGCSCWENAKLICTQQCLTITFMILNNLHCINNTCKVVHLVIILIRMNCCWKRPEGWTILLNLLQQSQITSADCPSQIAYFIVREKRFLGLLNDLPIILLVLIMIPIVLTVWISSHPQVTIPIVEPNIMDNVHMQQPLSSFGKLLPLVYYGGVELKESLYVDGQWGIECCPSNFTI
jgi:hypothetical protein